MTDKLPDDVIQTRSQYLAAGGVETHLEGQRLTPQEARRLALGGTESERIQLAANAHGLPLDVLWMLVNDTADQVAVSTLDNPDLPTELLLVLAKRFHRQPALLEAIPNHPNAPFASKLGEPVRRLPGQSIARFLDDVRATSDERAAFADAAQRQPDARLSDLWSTIRSAAL